MIRKQIYLDEESEHQLKSLAARSRRSEASLIREALDQFLARRVEQQPDDEDHPLLRLIGMGHSGKTDGAENHDYYLYGRGEE